MKGYGNKIKWTVAKDLVAVQGRAAVVQDLDKAETAVVSCLIRRLKAIVPLPVPAARSGGTHTRLMIQIRTALFRDLWFCQESRLVDCTVEYWLSPNANSKYTL